MVRGSKTVALKVKADQHRGIDLVCLSDVSVEYHHSTVSKELTRRHSRLIQGVICLAGALLVPEPSVSDADTRHGSPTPINSDVPRLTWRLYLAGSDIQHHHTTAKCVCQQSCVVTSQTCHQTQDTAALRCNGWRLNKTQHQINLTDFES